MGFNPEFSGRHNARYTASLMGFDAEQIDALMPRVEAFAEIGDYFDKPVRTYSSGMQMRVAFAVATAERPDILIVDEALSVGDMVLTGHRDDGPMPGRLLPGGLFELQGGGATLWCGFPYYFNKVFVFLLS